MSATQPWPATVDEAHLPRGGVGFLDWARCEGLLG
jgi:hypothetical protein